jgi:hypothetical protein
VPKIADFGLAKKVNKEDPLEEKTANIGTPVSLACTHNKSCMHSCECRMQYRAHMHCQYHLHLHIGLHGARAHDRRVWRSKL